MPFSYRCPNECGGCARTFGDDSDDSNGSEDDSDEDDSDADDSDEDDSDEDY
jgi:hypothetical protein